MRIPITAIGREYGLDPDQLYTFALEQEGYALRGTNSEDATIPVVMMRGLVHDLKQSIKRANKDSRRRFISESLEDFLKSRL